MPTSAASSRIPFPCPPPPPHTANCASARTNSPSCTARRRCCIGTNRRSCRPRRWTFRAEQLGYFSGKAHRLFTAGEVGDWITACEDAGLAADGDAEVAANVRGWRHDYDRATKLPADLVEEYERAKVVANTAWTEARRRSDFAYFAPHLENVFALTRRLADLWGYEATPYDALLEGFEPGARAAELDTLFATLRPAVVELLGPATERSARVPADLLAGHYPEAQQAAFNREVAGGARVRLCGGDDQHDHAPLLQRPRARRHPADDALRRGQFPRFALRRDARGRARHVRAGVAEGGVRHAGGHVRLAGHPRVAEPVVGKPGRPRAGVLGPLAAARGALFPAPGGADAGGDVRGRQPRAAVVHPRGGGSGDVRSAHHPAVRAGAADPRRHWRSGTCRRRGTRSARRCSG